MAELIDFFGDLSSVVDDHSSRKASSSERNLGLSLSLDAGFCSDPITKRSEKTAGEEGRKMASLKRKLEGEGKGNGIGEKEDNFRLKDGVVAGKREIGERSGEKRANYRVVPNEVTRREKRARQKRCIVAQAKGVNEVTKFQWASSSSDTNGKVEEEAMPKVKVERGDGGRVEGFLYKHRSLSEMRIICICHGRFWTPPDFVMHAGVGNVDSPLRHIHVVNPS